MTFFPIILLLLFIAIGMPVAFSLGLSGLIGILLIGGWDALIGTMSNTPYRSTANFLLSTVPMFILMAEVITVSGFTSRLFDAAYKWVGSLPGGLGISTIVAGGGLGAMSGSSTASAAALSSIAIPEMNRFNYSKELSAGTTAIGGTLAILIPPSIPLIIYGITTETSIGQLLIAGIVPGILMVVFYSLGIILWTKLNPSIAPKIEPFTWKERFESLLPVWPVLLLIFVVIGGIYSGFVTATESAAVGAFASILLAVLMKKLTLKDFKKAINSTLKSTTMILTIIIGAMVFSHYLVISRLAQNAIAFIGELPVPNWMILGVIIVIYIILGMFMDQIAILLLTLPLTFPLIISLGYDAIWFGIIVTVLVEVGLVTPPVGMNAYIISSSANVPLENVFKGSAILLIFTAIVFFILLFFPELSTWLPSKIMN